MEKTPHHSKRTFLLVTYGILLYMALQNISAVTHALSWIIAILQPLSYGIFIAFIINLFLEFFRNKVFHVMASSEKKWEQKLCPVLCGVCTALCACILLALIVFMIVPQIYTAIDTLMEKMPRSETQLMAWAEEKLTALHVPADLILKLKEFEASLDLETVVAYISNLMDGKVQTVLGSAFNVTASVLSTAANLVLGLIIAVYLLAQKDRVLYVGRKIIELVTPKRYHKTTFRVLHLTEQSFANFLSGQFIEAFIIGTLCTIGLTVFRFPYAATIGMITGITVLLPIIGAWIGGGIGLLLVAVEAPDRAIWFLLFILVLQQLEGQFIYPKVVGNSIGLPGVLVLIAVIVGGGFAGILGIMFAIPLFAIGYTLLKDAIDRLPDDPDENAEPEPVPEPTEKPEPAPAPEPETEPAPAPAPQPKPRRRKKRR